MDFKALFNSILPTERIITNSGLEFFSASTIAITRNIPAVLKPVSTKEIQAIVQVAKKEGLKLYPLSTGKNWGYSDALPVTDNNIILDLSLMNQILDYNPKLDYITLEPGVTQEQLHSFLEENGAIHMMSPTGSSVDTSIVGNYLERGFGLAPTIEHVNAVTSLEAVLPDCSLYQTILSAKHCKVIDKVHAHGLGPNANGLFFQSSLGIVTQITIRLTRKAESTALIIADANEQNIDKIIESLRGLRQRWNLPSLSFKIFNQLYVLAASGIPYPEEFLSKNEALPENIVQQMCKQNEIEAYSIAISFSGPAALTRALTREIRTTIRPLTQTFKIVNEKRYKLLLRFQKFLPKKIKDKLPILSTLWEFTQGTPSQGALGFAYWRSGQNPNYSKKCNPALDGCGLLAFPPIIPFQAESFREVKAILETVCPKHGINVLYNVANYADNYLIILALIVFDPQHQATQAHSCYNELLETSLKNGIAPYRLATPGMNRVFTDADFTSKLKRFIDPDGIISPGRYHGPV